MNNNNAYDGFLAFSQNTKYVCHILMVGLFLTFIILVAPINLGKGVSIIGRIIIIFIFIFVLMKNFNATHHYLKNTEGIFDKPNLSGVRNNMLLSHLLSLFIAILVLYIFITIFN